MSASNHLINFIGKVALITGASSGIGASTSVLFSQLGADVAITGRNLVNLDKTSVRCAELGNKPLMIGCDLTNDDQVKQLVSSTVQQYGRLDILVNCAGVVANGSIETTTLQQFDEMFNINVRSVYHLTMLAVPHLIKTRGNIVNVSSVNGIRAFSGVSAYCMSKSSIDMLTQCAALDLASKQVRVNSVNPGVVRSNLHMRGGIAEKDYPAFLERCKTTHALGRHGEPEEVARAIAFLASDSASFITGVQLPVDGGRHTMCPR